MTQEKLKSGGKLIMNLMGKMKNDKLLNAIHTTLKQAYVHTQVFTLPSERTDDIRNMIVVGSDRPIEFQAKGMAGFYEIQLEDGHIIRD